MKEKSIVIINDSRNLFSQSKAAFNAFNLYYNHKDTEQSIEIKDQQGEQR